MDGRDVPRGIYDPPTGIRAAGEKPAAERAALLPGLNDAYKAAGFVDNEVSRLVLVMGKDGFKIGATAYVFLQYVYIGIGTLGFTANGQVFTFVFSDIQPKLVTVHGRNLQRICDYISLRRMPWIRQADRDFRPGDGVPDAEPIITRIELQDWVRPEEQTGNPLQAMAGHDV